jgi:hypothetical protein
VPMPVQAVPAKTASSLCPMRRAGVIEIDLAAGVACGSMAMSMRMRSGGFWMFWPGDDSGSERGPVVAGDRAHGPRL